MEAEKPSETIGIVGLGLMGCSFSERLRRSHFAVLGWDVSAEKRGEYQRHGGELATSLSHLFGSTDRILLSLPNDAVVEQVLYEVRDQWRPELLVLDTTTGSAEKSKSLSREMRMLGARFVEVTFSGSSVQVREGTAVAMAAGHDEDLALSQWILRALSDQVILVGEIGNASKLKLITNLVLGLNRAALAEGLAFARAIGVELPRALELLRKTMAYSKIMDTKGEKMIDGDFRPQAHLSQHLKDVQLILKSVEPHGLRLPLSEAHRELLEKAEGLGWGDSDNSALFCALEGKVKGEEP